MRNISQCPASVKEEIAGYIKNDTLERVNQIVNEVTVKDTFYTRYGKRAIDIVVSLVVLLLTAPVNLVIAVITLVDVGRPLMFRQERIGKNCQLFTIYKFRNMNNHTDANGELLTPSQRVTKWGKLVRKTSLDELLNFVSILKGDMSLIGPRPLLSTYLDRFNNRHKQRFAVRPGLECPTPKAVGHVLSWWERLENDVWYVENCSLWVDITLVFRLIQMVFDRKSIAVRSKAGAGSFLGYNEQGEVITSYGVPEQYYEMYCRNHNVFEQNSDAEIVKSV